MKRASLAVLLALLVASSVVLSPSAGAVLVLPAPADFLSAGLFHQAKDAFGNVMQWMLHPFIVVGDQLGTAVTALQETVTGPSPSPSSVSSPPPPSPSSRPEQGSSSLTLRVNDLANQLSVLKDDVSTLFVRIKSPERVKELVTTVTQVNPVTQITTKLITETRVVERITETIAAADLAALTSQLASKFSKTGDTLTGNLLFDETLGLSIGGSLGGRPTDVFVANSIVVGSSTSILTGRSLSFGTASLGLGEDTGQKGSPALIYNEQRGVWMLRGNNGYFSDITTESTDTIGGGGGGGAALTAGNDIDISIANAIDLELVLDSVTTINAAPLTINGNVNLATADLQTAGTTRLTNAGALTNIASLNTHTIPAGTDTLVLLAAAQTLTSKTLTLPQINDTSADHQYVFAVNELAADRTVTLPLLAANDTFVFQDFAQTLTNKTLTAPTINAGTATALTGLAIRSTGTGAFDLTFANTENLTVGRTLTLTLNDAARTINLAGNLTTAADFITSGANSFTLTTTGVTDVTLPTTGILATLGGTETFSGAKTFSAASLTLASTTPSGLIIDNTTTGAVADSGRLYFRGNADGGSTSRDMSMLLDIVSTTDYRLGFYDNAAVTEVASLDESGNLQIDGALTTEADANADNQAIMSFGTSNILTAAAASSTVYGIRMNPLVGVPISGAGDVVSVISSVPDFVRTVGSSIAWVRALETGLTDNVLTAAATLTNYAGLYVKDPVVDHANLTINNPYGIYIADISADGATFTNTPIAIYQAGTNDLNNFLGDVTIGSSTIITSANIPGSSLVIDNGILCVDDGGDNCDDAARTAGSGYFEVGTGTNFDIAELFPISQPLKMGTLVSADPATPESLIASTKQYDSTLVGVVSTNPALTIGIGGENRFLQVGGKAAEDPNTIFETEAPIALAGRAPVRVSTENGPINSGDPITSSSQPGVGMKATRTGRIVGIALEAFNPQSISEGTIMVFVNPTWYVAPNAETLSTTSYLPTASSISGFSAELVAQIQDLFRVGGLRLRDGIVSFLELAVDKLFVREVVIEKTPPPFHTDALFGSGTVPEGAAEVVVANDNLQENSKVFVTIKGKKPYAWSIADIKPEASFTLVLSSQATGDTDFDYWIVQVR